VRWRTRALTLLLFVLASAAVVLPNALGDPRVSVFDEMTHTDWVASLRDGELVRRGDTIDPEVLVEWACRGWVYDEGLPACADAPGDPATYPARGLNYNPFHPPGYYLPTAIGSAVVAVVAPGTDVVTASRVVGVGWSVLAMVGVYALARELGARVSVARAAGVAVVGFPLVAHLLSIVNNDAAVLAAGALVTWVGVRAVRGRVPWWWLGGAGALAALTKVVVLPAVIASVVLLVAVALWWTATHAERRRLLAGAALVAVGFVVVTGAWLGLQSLRASGIAYVDPIPGDVTGSDVPWAVVGVAFDTLPPTAGARSPMDVSPRVLEVVTTWGEVGDLVLVAVPFALVVAGLGAAAARRRRVVSPVDHPPVDYPPADHPTWLGVPLGMSVVAGLVMGAAALNVQHWLAKGSAVSVLHPRYGLALLAALLGGLALLADRHRSTRAALWVFSGAGVVVAVIAAV